MGLVGHDKSFDCIIGVIRTWDFPGGPVVKNPPFNAGDAGSIPELGRSMEEGIVTHSSILAWRIPWTEEPGPYMKVVTYYSNVPGGVLRPQIL